MAPRRGRRGTAPKGCGGGHCADENPEEYGSQKPHQCRVRRKARGGDKAADEGNGDKKGGHTRNERTEKTKKQRAEPPTDAQHTLHTFTVSSKKCASPMMAFTDDISKWNWGFHTLKFIRRIFVLDSRRWVLPRACFRCLGVAVESAAVQRWKV